MERRGARVAPAAALAPARRLAVARLRRAHALRRRRCSSCCPSYGAGPSAVPGRAARRVREPLRGRRGRAAARPAAAAPAARPAAGDRRRLRGHGAPGRLCLGAARAAGSLHRPAVAGRAGATRAAAAAQHATCRAGAARTAPRSAPSTRMRSRTTSTAPASRATDPRALAVPVREHRPAPAGRHARPPTEMPERAPTGPAAASSRRASRGRVSDLERGRRLPRPGRALARCAPPTFGLLRRAAYVRSSEWPEGDQAAVNLRGR